jgi:phage-related protein
VINIATVAELMVKIGADVSSLNSGLLGAGKSVGGFSAESTAMSQKIGIGVLAAGAAIIGFGAACIKMYANAQTVTLALNNLTGSAAKTNTMVSGLAAAFKGSTFSTPDLENSAEVLLKLGFNAQQVVPIMKDVGNAVSAVGLGKPAMDAVDGILGKINTTGKVTAKQLTSMGLDGVDAMGILEAKFNETGPQLTKSISSGAITTAQVMSALTTGMAAKYGGDMQKAANTINGQFTIIKNDASDAMIKIGGILSASLPIKGILTTVANIATSFDTIVSKSKTLGQLFNNLFSTKTQIILAALSGVLVAALIPALSLLWLDLQIGALKAALFLLEMGPMMILFAAIAVAAYLIIKNWSSISTFFINLWNGIKSVVVSVWDSIVVFFAKTIPTMINGIILWFEALPGRIGTFMAQLPNSIAYWFGFAIGSALKFVINGIASIISFFAALPGRISSFVVAMYNDIINWFSQLPGRVTSYFSAVYNGVSSWMSNTYNKAISLAKNIASGIASGIAAIPGEIVQIGARILSYIGSLPSQLLSKAESMGASLWAGFKKGLFGSPRTLIEDSFINMATQANATLDTMSGLVPKYQSTVAKFATPIMGQIKQPLTTSTAPITAKATIASSNNQATSAQGQSIVNQFNIPSLTVRSAADIKAIAQQLFRLQQSQYRSQGGTI